MLENGGCQRMPGWRNWQTRRTQNPVLARESEFDPRSGHHFFMNFTGLDFFRELRLDSSRE
jgi:hypothetical protein